MMRSIYLALALASAAAVPALAQASGSPPRLPTRVPVLLVMSDTPRAQPYTIVRRPDADPYDVVVFSANADSAALSAAVTDLLLMRQVQGDTITTTGGMMRIRPSARAPLPLPWAGRVMRDLAQAERRDVIGVGAGRAKQIWLPPQHRRSAPPSSPPS